MPVLFLTLALLASAPADTIHTFTRAEQWTVTVRATDGKTLAGVTLSLCPGAQIGDADACRFAVTGADGRAMIDRPADSAVLAAELPGFAKTTIGPLSPREDPVAPDQFVVVLNPVCWHC